MRTRYPLLAAALFAAGLVTATPLAAVATCSETHMTVVEAEPPATVAEPATTRPAPAPEAATTLQAKAPEPSADRPARTEPRPGVR